MNESHALAELQRKNEELRAELSNVAYAVSHDVQAPVRGIASFLSFLREESGDTLSEEGTKYLDYLDELSAQLTSMVKDLVQYSRITSAELRLHEVDVCSLLHDVMENHDALTEVQVTSNSEVGDCIRRIDTELFMRLLHELIENSIRYMQLHTGIEPQLRVGVTEKNGTPVVFFADNGIGFDDQYSDNAFSMFSTAHEEKHGRGNGIGLALVQRIVRMHGGKIRLLSQPGEGMRVEFTLWPDDPKTE